MTTPHTRLRLDELSEVEGNSNDPALRVLEVAILVEDSVDLVLSDAELTDPRLDSPHETALMVADLLECP